MKKPLFALPLVLAVCAAAGARAEPTDLGRDFR
ncbi:hypothetical protein BPK10_02173 [Bordetella pertussis]|nr:hypothetical protein BPK10_02173 [Bordetella pertussis]